MDNIIMFDKNPFGITDPNGWLQLFNDKEFALEKLNNITGTFMLYDSPGRDYGDYFIIRDGELVEEKIIDVYLSNTELNEEDRFEHRVEIFDDPQTGLEFKHWLNNRYDEIKEVVQTLHF